VNQPNHSAVTLARLKGVDWEPAFSVSLAHARSRAKLMHEYLRRAALWAEELGGTTKWPFFDIAGSWAPDVDVPAEFAEELEKLIGPRINSWDANPSWAALRWAAMLDAGVSVPAHLDDPFEPLLLLFERGGGQTIEAGFIDLGGSSVLQKTWQDHLSTEPVTALDPATLDALDKKTAD
jgi:hypothetical protein